MARLTFALRMVLARFKAARRHCPYCGSCLAQRLQRKWLLIEARKCHFCGLIFRYPTDDPKMALRFYENEYSESKVQTPTDEQLRNMRAADFHGTIADKTHRLPWLRRNATAGKTLDFGCSWGYGVAQLREAGFDAFGYEVCRRRAAFGRDNLGVAIESDWDRLLAEHRQSVGLIYADHVLEHLPDLRATLDGFAELLTPGGRLVMFVPNGGGRSARALGVHWGPFLGETHTMALTAEWLRTHLPAHGFELQALGSSPDRLEVMLDGDELACVAGRVILPRPAPEKLVAPREPVPCVDSSAGSSLPTPTN